MVIGNIFVALVDKGEWGIQKAGFVSYTDIIVQAEALQHSNFRGIIRSRAQTGFGVARSSLTAYGSDASMSPSAQAVFDTQSDRASLLSPM